MIKACEGPQAAQVLYGNVFDKRLPVVLDDLIPNRQEKKEKKNETESYRWDSSFYFYAWLAAISATFLFFIVSQCDRESLIANVFLKCNLIHILKFTSVRE